jgi:uncharacterized protein YdgA (DUF945 family)
MNKLIKIVMVVTALLLILPKYIGSLVETEHQNTLDKLSKNPVIEIKEKNFISHWFSGLATTEMVILLQDNTLEDLTLVIEETLSFGPIIFADDGLHFGLSHSRAHLNFKNIEALDPDLKELIKDKIHLSSLFTFSKNVIATLVVDEVLSTRRANEMHFKPVNSEFTITRDNRMYGNFHWAGLSFKANEEGIKVGEVSFNVDQTLIDGSYYDGTAITVGEFDFVIGSLVTTDSITNQPLTLESMSFKGTSNVVENQLKIALNYHIDTIDSFEHKLSNVNLDIEVDSLGLEAVKSLNEFLSNFSADANELMTPENMQKLGAIIEKLLSSGPSITVSDLSVETAQGNILSTGSLKVDQALYVPTNPMSLLQALQVDVTAEAPEKYIQKLGLLPAANQYVEQGLLLKENNKLTTKVDFSKGKLTVNSIVIPL